VSATEIVRAEGISKRFVLHKDKSIKERIINVGRSNSHREDFWALTGVDLSVSSGTTLGLVGHNGSGKSTLLKIIGGIIQPTAGLVRRRGRLAALLELGAGFHPDLTGRENVYLNASILGLTRAETTRYFSEIVEFAGIEEFIDTQVKFYSSGMYVRLAFAVAVHVNPDLLLVDEVLAVGDEPFQRKCINKISEFQKEGRTILLVTHSAEQVSSLCDRVVVLDHGKMIFDGDSTEGLRVLRSTFEAEEAADAPTAAVTGTQLRKVRVRGAELGMGGAIAAGSDLKVEIGYHVERAPSGWIAGIEIENEIGQLVYRINTQGLGLTLPTGSGDYALNIDLPENGLAGGKYSVRASMVTSTGAPLAPYPITATFDIEDDPRGVGVLQFKSTASLTKID
jgi:ABC-2 type transport system ATP-binding protein